MKKSYTIEKCVYKGIPYCVDYLIVDNRTGDITAVGIGVSFEYGGTPVAELDELVIKQKNG